jgi:2-oxoglutarate dehydrogenase E2 component (dihydrolipoamide succinyltransferase)
MRQRIATRLKDAQNTAAMLTTFNEVDMRFIRSFSLPSIYNTILNFTHDNVQ